MGHRTIKWSRRSIQSRDKIVEWYLSYMGFSSARKFIEDLHSTATHLAEMPTIGILDETCSTENRTYYSFPIHPKYRIVYRYTSRTIYIVGIRSNSKKTKFC